MHAASTIEWSTARGGMASRPHLAVLVLRAGLRAHEHSVGSAWRKFQCDETSAAQASEHCRGSGETLRRMRERLAHRRCSVCVTVRWMPV